jgi:predicted GIY-YIG superfamily endonuclease
LRGEFGRHDIGSTDNVERRLADHRRGSNSTTRRLGGKIEVRPCKEVPTMGEARALELELKRKKNHELAVYRLSVSR